MLKLLKDGLEGKKQVGIFYMTCAVIVMQITVFLVSTENEDQTSTNHSSCNKYMVAVIPMHK